MLEYPAPEEEQVFARKCRLECTLTLLFDLNCGQHRLHNEVVEEIGQIRARVLLTVVAVIFLL